MYEILVNATMPLELEQFFEATNNFGKKFYTFTAEFFSDEYLEEISTSPDKHYAMIKIMAIAISREMTYILYFEPYAKFWKDEKIYQEKCGGDSYLAGEFPRYNLIPEDIYLRKQLYPYEHNGDYRDVFFWNNFIPVGDIRKL